ncbi:unnamed protein product, partial [Rotaria magnacalcarata]
YASIPVAKSCRRTFKSVTSTSVSYDSRPRSVIVTDLNDDKKLDFALANSGADTIGVYFGDGNGILSDQKTYSIGRPCQPFSIAVGHFNSDNRVNIMVAYRDTNSLALLVGHPNGTFILERTFSLIHLATDHSPHNELSQPSCVLVADINNDTYQDIVVANPGTDNIGVLLRLGLGNGSFVRTQISTIGFGSGAQSLAAGDSNNDHLSDIIVNNNVDNHVIVLLRDSIEQHLNPIEYPTLQNVRSTSIVGGISGSSYNMGTSSDISKLAVGDFDNDGKLDLALTMTNGENVEILFGDGSGQFRTIFLDPEMVDIFIQDAGFTDSGLHPSAVSVGDFNKDNIPDMAIANMAHGNIDIRLGFDNKTFRDEMIFSTGAGSFPS